MKTNTLAFLLISTIIILFLSGCGTNLNSINAGNTICSNYSNKPMSSLEVGLVHKMTERYMSEQHENIKATIADDAHSIWFDLETLKEFVYQLEYNTKKNRSTVSSQDLGVRIYYASYPDKTWNDYTDLQVLNGKGYEKLHTLVMVPTFRNKAGVNLDFDPMVETTFDYGLKGSDKYSGTKNANKISVLSSMPVKSNTGSQPVPIGAQNHGSLIPPGDPNGENFSN